MEWPYRDRGGFKNSRWCRHLPLLKSNMTKSKCSIWVNVYVLPIAFQGSTRMQNSNDGSKIKHDSLRLVSLNSKNSRLILHNYGCQQRIKRWIALRMNELESKKSLTTRNLQDFTSLLNKNPCKIKGILSPWRMIQSVLESTQLIQCISQVAVFQNSSHKRIRRARLFTTSNQIVVGLLLLLALCSSILDYQ